MKFLPVIAAATIALIASTAGSAAAAPPSSGAARPAPVIPKPIAFGFTGAVIVGPVSACGASGSGATVCADAGRFYRQLYRPAGGGSWKLDRISNVSGNVLYTTPYAKGWQWVWAPRVGFGVMQAHDLYTYGVIS